MLASATSSSAGWSRPAPTPQPSTPSRHATSSPGRPSCLPRRSRPPATRASSTSSVGSTGASSASPRRTIRTFRYWKCPCTESARCGRRRSARETRPSGCAPFASWCCSTTRSASVPRAPSNSSASLSASACRRSMRRPAGCASWARPARTRRRRGAPGPPTRSSSGSSSACAPNAASPCSVSSLWRWRSAPHWWRAAPPRAGTAPVCAAPQCRCR
mmetsp:Transcript_33827/g.107895  ORF Transcript_33827/g.107895 Transcript_33827/m.107895 type:complete len:216 (-) Transcript_33827:3442-4089(-)